MSIPTEVFASKVKSAWSRDIHIPSLNDGINWVLDHLPNRRLTFATMGLIEIISLLGGALGSAGEVQAAPLQPALNPDHVATYHDASLPLYAPPDAVEPQKVTSVDCPPLPVAGGYEINYQPPIVTCSTYEYEGQTVLSYDIIPPNRPGLYLINPTPGKLVITSNIEGLFPFLAFYTNFRQQTLTADQIGLYLYDQDKPVDMQINGRRVPVKAQGMDVIVSCRMEESGQNCDYIILADGTEIRTYELIRQMFLSSGLNPDKYDIGYMTPAPMIDTSTTITDQFQVFVDATATPEFSPWDPPTPTPYFETPTNYSPIYATASIGQIAIIENGLIVGYRNAEAVETPISIEAPISHVTNINFNFNLLGNPNQKFKVTHCNTDTRNPIPLSPDVANSLDNSQSINNPLELFRLADAITSESGSAWDEKLADILFGGKYQDHYEYLTEKVKASDLGNISIKAAQIDSQNIVHLVGQDQNFCWISLEMKASTLRKLFKTEGFMSAFSSIGENEAAAEIIRTMLTQTTQVKKIAYTIPPQYVEAASVGSTWAEAWHAIQTVGTIPAYFTGPDLVVNPNFSLVNIPVGSQVKPVGFYTDIYGTIYAIVTPDDFGLTPALIGAQQALGLAPYSDTYLIIPLNSLISSTKQP